jgi:hypothetical protein
LYKFDKKLFLHLILDIHCRGKSAANGPLLGRRKKKFQVEKFFVSFFFTLSKEGANGQRVFVQRYSDAHTKTAEISPEVSNRAETHALAMD